MVFLPHYDVALQMTASGSGFVHGFGPDWNMSTTIGWIAMTCDAVINSLRVNSVAAFCYKPKYNAKKQRQQNVFLWKTKWLYINHSFVKHIELLCMGKWPSVIFFRWSINELHILLVVSFIFIFIFFARLTVHLGRPKQINIVFLAHK